MFDVAGLKVAMENAEEYIKEKADFVTLSNNESGVANAIKKFVFDLPPLPYHGHNSFVCIKDATTEKKGGAR